MQQVPFTISLGSPENLDRFNDPIIERTDVMWAARRFILLFGDQAADVADREASRLDLAGKLHVAEMFTRVHEECVRLLKNSEKYRTRKIH